jgi:hypothetical protein
MLSLSKPLAGGALVLAATLAPSAHALTYTLNYLGYNQSPAETAYVNLQGPAPGPFAGTYGAGAFTFTAAPDPTPPGVAGPSFIAYCVELLESLGSNVPGYNALSGLSSYFSSATVRNDIARLFDVGYADSLTSAAKSAGFQMALWEVIYESSGSYSLTSGKFIADGSNAADAAGAGYLSALAAAGVGSQQFTIWQKAGAQDYIQVGGTQRVPEPATFALVLVVFGLVVARRR